MKQEERDFEGKKEREKEERKRMTYRGKKKREEREIGRQIERKGRQRGMKREYMGIHRHRD